LCNNGAYYSGWTTNPQARFLRHQSGKAAAYTRMHKPLEIVYLEELPDRSSALKREHQLQKLTHSQKAELIARQKQTQDKD